MASELFLWGARSWQALRGTERANPTADTEQLKTGPSYIQLEGYKEQLGGGWGWGWVREAAGAWFDPANLGGAEPEQPWPGLLRAPLLIPS